MKYLSRFLDLAIVLILLFASCFAVVPQSGRFNFANASAVLPVNGSEYANGPVTLENSPLKVWYNWVNVSNTQVVSYAAYTNSDYPYPVPIANFVGQHFQLANDTEIFVASALDKFEVYRDINGDGIPQSDAASGNNEILYWIYTNMSDSYSIIPIQKSMIDSTPHYTWGFTYRNAYAYLENYTTVYGLVGKMIFDHITLSYDFSVIGNLTNLKTNFDIGKVSNLTSLSTSSVSLKGLSLALLYTTSAYTTKAYLTYVDSQPYNSTATNNSTIAVQTAQINVGETNAYDFIFGGNYTLSIDENDLTQQPNNQTYTAKSEVVALSSLPWKTYGSPVWQTSFIGNAFNLTDLFGGSWSPVNMNYDASPLIYRICFPVWDGRQIQHDPVYIAHLSETSTVPEFPTWTILPALLITPLVIAFAIKKKLPFNRPRLSNSDKARPS